MKFPIANKKILYFVLIALIVLGIFCRAVEVINKNYLWGFDHGREYLMVKDIVVGHHFRLIGTPLGAGSAGINGIFHGPGYYYFLAIPFILFRGDPYGGVVLMFLFGIGSLFVLYFLGKKLFGTLGGLLLTSLAALSPPLISQSRAIWSPFPSTFFIVLSLYFTYTMLRAGKKREYFYIFLSSFFAGFIYNFEFAIAVPLTISLLIYSCFIFKKKITKYISLLAGFLVSYVPMIFFEVRHNFMAIHGFISYISSHKSSHGPNFMQNLADHFYVFLFNVVNTFPSQTLIPAFLLLVIIIVSFIIIVKKEKDKIIKGFLKYLFLLPVLTFIVLAFLRNTVYLYYLFHLNIVYILLFAYILISAVSLKNRPIKYVFIFLFLFFSFEAVPTYVKMINYDLRDYGGDAKIRGKEDALDFVYHDAAGKHFGLLVFMPPVYTYPYEYLIEWYGQKKYGYIPTKDKKGLFYLIIEVDPAKPWSYQGWIETVVKSGKLISETKLPSGIIIQKRYQE